MTTMNKMNKMNKMTIIITMTTMTTMTTETTMTRVATMTTITTMTTDLAIQIQIERESDLMIVNLVTQITISNELRNLNHDIEEK